MATFIQSIPSVSGTTKPQSAGYLIRSDEWGIDNLMPSTSDSPDFIIQNETITKEAITDTTQDQKGAVVSQLDYDYHWTLSCDLIGDKDAGEALESGVGDITFNYAGQIWKLTSCTYTGTYNDKKKWSISAERWVNFPQAGG